MKVKSEKNKISKSSGNSIFSVLFPYIYVGSFDGELIKPLVVVNHAVACSGRDQLRAQHPPG